MESKQPSNKTWEEVFADAPDLWIYEDEEGSLNGDQFNYSITPGNEKIVFIKAGAGGSARGHENKYTRMAERLHARLGATVICASNPIDPIIESPDAQEIRLVANELGFASFELYLIGISDGAYMNLELASQFTEAVKWIGINASYYDTSELEAKLKSLSSVQKIMVIGTEDRDSAALIPMLIAMEDDSFSVKLCEGADHSFTGMTDRFIELSDLV